MSQAVMQHSFHAGEWAPALNARVDVAKYKSGAALMKNFYPDYRGGASSRPGTLYCLQAYKSGFPVRLIPFQQNFTTNFVLEFGQGYIRPFFQGAPILEAGINITAATQANPCVLTTATNNYNVGDWVFISSVVGMTQLNNRYFQVIAVSPTSVTLGDLNGNAINSTTFGAYVSGGTIQRVYTITSPYAAADLALLKFAQNINTLILCHPDYQPSILTISGLTNWTLTTITFGATIAPPTGITVTSTLAAGSVNYSYVVTAVDVNGQESPASPPAGLSGIQDLRSVAGTNKVTWTGSSGAVSYNVYRAQISYSAIPAGSDYGFCGNCTGTNFIDSNIAADFTAAPPIVENPFFGSPVQSVSLTGTAVYTAVPTVTIAPPSTGVQATAQAILGIQSFNTFHLTGSRGNVYAVNDLLAMTIPGTTAPIYCTMTVTSVSSGSITGVSLTSFGGLSSGSAPSVLGIGLQNGTAIDQSQNGYQANFVWQVSSVNLLGGGSGYTSVPTVTFSPVGATATAVLGAASSGNPSVPTFYQQRLVLAGPPGNPEQFNMSQTGSYFNYNTNSPVEADDAIQGTLVSTSLQNIKSMLSMSTGLVILSDRAAWLLNGGSIGSAVTPSSLVANPHSYNGASDVPPIVSNFDILYVQAKGSIVRDLTFNFYAQIYTGTDISILSSHLFYNYTIKEWAYAEEPFKLIWAVRSDGALLSLTFLKEQDIIGWSQHNSPGANGLFKSVCTVVESRPTTDGRALVQTVDAPYFVVQRTVNGQTLQYIERLAERSFLDPATATSKVKYAWTVDSGLQYNGAPTTAVGGLFHLIGQQVVGLADGVPVGPLTVTAQGTVALANAASLITLGLAYTPQLQTLQLDIGEPTIQGKRKKIPAVTARVQDTLGLSIGKTFSSLVAMKDLVIGNVGTMTNAPVTDLVTGDARTIIDPSWDVPGQYCFQQSKPFPATILGVIPEIVVGDTPPASR